ncbi:MAG: T9SS type A sorting domain-containing protein [Bacteroidales bacterium]|jgi:hypothetical protein
MDELLSNYNIFYPEQEGFIALGDHIYSSLNELQDRKGLDLNSFNNDPLFVDVYNDNFDLEPGSPGIDAGMSVGLVQDFLGNEVPLGGAPDIGIIEKRMNVTAEKPAGSESESNLFSVFPNPTNGRFHVNCDGVNDRSASLSVKDLTGRTVYESECYSKNNRIRHTVNLSGLKKGIYIILLQCSDRLYSQRLMQIE